MGTVKVKYTVGVGNNIFQYMYARLLAYSHYANLSNPPLPCLGVEGREVSFAHPYPVVEIGKSETDFHQYLYARSDPVNYLVHTYPEDYTLYKPYMDMIRTWVEDVPMTHKKDLVFHLRLGDRLMRATDHIPGMKSTPQDYMNAIKMFDYDQLYICTDMPSWGYLTPEQLANMKFHTSIPKGEEIDPAMPAKYHNELVEELEALSPVVRYGCKIKDDFEFMRSFGQILFKHGTLAWWAAALSHADKVGVFGPWRPNKGDRNKNLGRTDFDGWFQWGN